MSPTLGGPPFCTSCGHQEGAEASGRDDLFAQTTLYDASEFGLGSGPPDEAGATKVMPAYKPPVPARTKKKRRHVPGESIFASQLQVEPGPLDKTPGKQSKRPRTRGSAVVEEDGSSLDLPLVAKPGTESRLEVAPLREEALFLPRCKHCERALELEEVAGGVCRQCRRERSKRRRRGMTFSRVARAVSGTLAAFETLWVGALLVLMVLRGGVAGGAGAGIVALGVRGGLVLFAAFAAVSFARGRDWAAGAAVAFGPLAVVLTALQLRSGALSGDLMTAAAWLGAGAVGALAALVATTCFGPASLPTSALLDRRKRRRSGRMPAGSRVMRKGSRDLRENGGGAGPSTRGSREIVGGVLALVGAGVIGWQAVAAALGAAPLKPLEYPSAQAEVLLVSAGLFSLAALCLAFLGVWLLVRPPAEDTHIGGVVGAALAGGLPALLLVGSLFLGASLLFPLTLVWGGVTTLGAGRFFLDAGMESSLPHAAMPLTLVVSAATGIVVALVAEILALFSSSPARGRALAGFGLSWALLWGASLAGIAMWT